MRIVRDLPLPSPVTTGKLYNFDQLRHGDAFEIAPGSSVASAREMFRRWRKRTGRAHAKLVRSEDPNCANLLFFIESPLSAVRPAAKPEPVDIV